MKYLEFIKRAVYLDKASVEHYILVGDLTFAIGPLLALGWRWEIT